VARTAVKNFYAAGFDALVKRWDKLISVGGHDEKQILFFQIRISYVLRCISLRDLFADSLGL
jgi:hypothetical protein